MTATEIAAQALPCPFCGEKLIVVEDQHGQYVEHPETPEAAPVACFLGYGVAQLFEEVDLKQWNTRDGVRP